MATLIVGTNENDPARLADAIRQMAEGRSNAHGTCTISANANSTLVTAPNCSVSSVVILAPTTTHAAWHMATTYTVAANGTFRIVHANNTFTDANFGYICLG